MEHTVTSHSPGGNTPDLLDELCGCPRQGDLWLCRARPHLECTPEGHMCELGLLLNATDCDYWPGDPIGRR